MQLRIKAQNPNRIGNRSETRPPLDYGMTHAKVLVTTLS